jgi:hypothetical protein
MWIWLNLRDAPGRRGFDEGRSDALIILEM